MSRDRRRGNPAREIEKLASATVRKWVGANGIVTDTSSGHGPDFRIDYHDGRVGLGEVGWHPDPRIEAMWARTHRSKTPQEITLPAGCGYWAVQLVAGAKISKLERELPALIERLSREGVFRRTISGEWPRDELSQAIRSLGVTYVNRVSESTRDGAFYAMPATGGAVPREADGIVEWLDYLINEDPAYTDMTAKLLLREADERHVFVMSGSATPFGVDERLRRFDEAIPIRRPQLPEGITHVWVAAQFNANELLAMWSERGWVRVQFPTER